MKKKLFFVFIVLVFEKKVTIINEIVSLKICEQDILLL